MKEIRVLKIRILEDVGKFFYKNIPTSFLVCLNGYDIKKICDFLGLKKMEFMSV
ncbi:hypothetical protein [Clostridioides sp. ES-S-0190-01]|uniref:hypothetical protein n=1 Tax=Clostridioides sp. ES-S-0190-01 TaxID=2770787 RepID=UPI001D125212